MMIIITIKMVKNNTNKVKLIITAINWESKKV